MQIIDSKAIFGIFGTITTWMISLVEGGLAEQVLINPSIISATAVAIYMLVKAYNEYKKGKIEREQM